MQPASHRDSHTHPDSAQTQHTTSIAPPSVHAPFVAAVRGVEERCGRRRAHLEDGDEVFVLLLAGPLVEALAALDDDKRGEDVAVRRRALPVGVVLDRERRGHHRLELRLHVQLPLPLESLPVEVELDRSLHRAVRSTLAARVPSTPWKQQAMQVGRGAQSVVSRETWSRKR